MQPKQSFPVSSTSTSPLPDIVTVHYSIKRVGGLRTERTESLMISKYVDRGSKSCEKHHGNKYPRR